MTFHLADARVVITGAGRGIGRAMAERFAAEGARLAVNDLDADACAAVSADLGALSLPGDASSPDGVARLIADATAGLGGIDVFCANAGIEAGGADTDDAWQRSWDVNVMSHVRAFRALAPTWLERGQGRFVATVSAAGLLMMPGAAAYSATKHAALAHAEWLSATYGDRGITVQVICPLGVRTDMVRLDTPHGALVLGPTLIEPSEVADAVVAGLADDRFLILPHPQVRDFYLARATDTDRWLAGMRRVQAAIDAHGT
jgi:NAD(P)-dependent dehydrogenase (short-subunit alcohol dehydrogenase family)